jgi:hypothetical protein
MSDLENGMVVGRFDADNGAEPYREETARGFPPAEPLPTKTFSELLKHARDMYDKRV